MGRGRGVSLKRALGRKRKKDRDDEDDDGDDEEYVAEDEEEEEEDSLCESDFPNEESFEENEASSTAGSSAAEEEVSYAKLKARRGYSSRRQRSRVSNYEELEDDNYEEDEDFSPGTSNEEEDWEEDSLVSGDSSGSDRRGTPKRGRRKQKRKILNPKANKRSRKGTVATKRRKPRREADEEEDDDFIVKDHSAVVNHRKNKKVVKRRANSRSVMKNSSPADSDSFDAIYSTSSDDLLVKDRVVAGRSKKKMRANCGRRKKLKVEDSETSDSDFVISDEDFIDDCHGVVAWPRKIGKNERKKVGSSAAGRLEESDCLYPDDKVVQNEIRVPAIDRGLSLPKPERDFVATKGKDKEADELSKQLCGICLSEEQKGTIQGILSCCSHYYCFSCIMEWSKVESRCPLCKRRFVTITKSSRSDPSLEMRRPVIRVQMRDQVYQPSEEELRVLLDPYENVVCLECHQGGDDSLMLLCDICDSSAHTYCVGLGREVPEGNWYCECCRIAGEGSLHSQVLDSQASISGRISHGSAANNSSRLQRNTSLHCPVSSQEQSSQGFDLNIPPRNFFEDNGIVSATQAPGAAALTVSGRRAIHRRIRILLSNHRARQINAEFNVIDTAVPTEDVHSMPERNVDSLETLERSNLFYRAPTAEQRHENGRNVSHSSSDLVPCISSEGRKFRHVEGAKKQVQSIVRHYLKKLRGDIKLERRVSKKIAKKATHAILAACGIQHSRSMVSTIVQPPDSCSHDLDGGPVNLLRGCCSSCFTTYVSIVVKMLVESM